VASNERWLPRAGGLRHRDRRPVQSGDRWHRLVLGIGHTARASTQDLLVEGSRLHLGLGSELPLEGRHAALILAQGSASLSRFRVELHWPWGNRPPERTDVEEPLRGLHRRLQRARRAVKGEKAPETTDGQLAQPLALGE